MTEDYKQIGEKDYQVKRPFKFHHHSGQFPKCTFINMKEPKGVHTDKYMALQDLFIKSMMDFTKNNDNKEDTSNNQNEKIDQKAIKILIQQSDRAGSSIFVKCFKDLALSNSNHPILVLNNEEKIKFGDFDEMYPEDLFDLAIDWFFFFGMPSLEGLNG